MTEGKIPSLATDAVLVESCEVPEDTPKVRGYDFENGPDLQAVMDAYKNVGFQGTSLGNAMDRINEMLAWRLSDEEITADTLDEHKDPEVRKKTRCKIFLGYTSNLISSGVRESIKYLAKNKMVDVIVSSAGGIEEDFIKCLAPTFLGDFSLKGEELRKKGINRIGNLIVPNDNYIKFEKWIWPILTAMLEEQKTSGVNWTPSKIIHRLGKEINHEDSVYYWAYKNNIPVFCPSLTDGSIGDMLFFHSYKHPGLIVDLVEDIRLMNSEALYAVRSGMIILGGGLVKHHICNANLMRNGANYAVFVNTGQEFDGSDAGARPDEAVSWGKIALGASPVKVYADATIVFPLLVSQTFAKNFVPKDK